MLLFLDMPRTVVPLITGEVYHVYNRGSDKRRIFDDKQDYLRFYQSLYLFNSAEPVINFSSARTNIEQSRNVLVDIYAYALLPNHFHILLEQKEEGGISEFMKRVLGGYTSYYNERYIRSGTLFQGTFKRVHVDSDEQYRYLFAYVNENHVVHNIQRSDEVIYSSSLHYQGIRSSKAIRTHLDTTRYDLEEHRALARSIYERRAIEKRTLHETE